MKTILVCNQKGGVGKSLVADEIAFSFERSGIPVSFYDLDAQVFLIAFIFRKSRDKSFGFHDDCFAS